MRISIIKYLVPYGIVTAMIRARDSRRVAEAKRRISAHVSERSLSGGIVPFAHRAAIEFHSARGLAWNDVRDGSIPEASLQYCSKVLDEWVAPQDGEALLGLHVGNFVGISLCHFLDYVKRRSSDAVVVSIDPNLSHRGIDRPQEHAIALANYFGLQDNLIICVGYSCEKSISNDGKTFEDEAGGNYDPFMEFGKEMSCGQQLLNLGRASANKFDFAVLDGNHDASYLGREVDLIQRLLKPEGLLILDDITDHWEDIRDKFVELQSKGWTAIGTDGRVGILQRTIDKARSGAGKQSTALSKPT